MATNNDITNDGEQNTTAVNLTEGNAASFAASSVQSLTGVRVPGTFSLNTVQNLNFFEQNMGEVRNLLLKLLETPRETGNFVQLDHRAHLVIPCDFEKFIAFNADSAGVTTTSLDANEDDAYQFLGITLTNDRAVVGNDAVNDPKLISSSQFKLDLHPELAAVDANNDPLHVSLRPHTKPNNDVVPPKAYYDSDTKMLISNWFPSGAVLVDLKNTEALEAMEKNVTVGSAVNSDAATYQVDADKTIVGMTLFAQITVNCNNTTGSPTLFVDATFQPSGDINLASGTVLGARDHTGLTHNEITIHLINEEDFTKAQKVVLARGNDTVGQLKITPFTSDDADANTAANPGPNDADDFSITISLNDLGGANDPGTIGAKMVDAIQSSIASVNQFGDRHLLEKFTVTVDQIDFEAGSDFSGYMRALAAASTNEQPRPANMPIREGEKFIVQNPASITLNITPFEYQFTSADYTGNVEPFKIIDQMEVYAVLEHSKNAGTAPVLQTAADDNGPLPILTV